MKKSSCLRALPVVVLLGAGLLALTSRLSFGADEADTAKSSSIRIDHKIAETDLPALAKISFADALKTALAAVPGKLLKAELEVEDGGLQYSAEIVTPAKKIAEVEIDAGNGRVLAIDTDEDND